MKSNIKSILLILLATIFIYQGCTKSGSCCIYQTTSENTQTTYTYDANGEVSSITTNDTVNNIREHLKISRDKDRIEIKSNAGSQIYHLDDNRRIATYSFYTTFDLYEYNFLYNNEGFLKSAKKERFIDSGANIFATNDFKYIYQDNDLTHVTDNQIMADGYEESGYTGLTTYNIGYFNSDEIGLKDLSALMIIINELPNYLKLAYKNAQGRLPKKLIKSIVRKSDGYPSFTRFFNYQIDPHGRVTKITETWSGDENRNVSIQTSISYKCTPN